MAKRTQIWQQFSQDYCKMVIPNRPSPEDCQNYSLLINQVLKNKKRVRILVMGSTPELRSLLFTYTCLQKARVYCLDFSENMYRAMTDFIAKTDLKEKFIKGNWLKTGIKDDFFDLVVGDEVICNVPVKGHAKLFQEVKRILKKDGFWITRHNFYLPNEIKPEQIILKTVKDIVQGKYGFQTAINYLYILLFYNMVQKNKQRRVNMAEETREMEKAYKKLKDGLDKKALKALIKHFKENWRSIFDYYWYVLSKKDSERELKPFFEIKKILYARDYITAKNSPICLLKVKK